MDPFRSRQPLPDPVRAQAEDLLAFIGASPTPFHCVAEAARRLSAAGFNEVSEHAELPRGAGARFLVRGGALVAWTAPSLAGATTPFRIVGAHTDSPNLRLRPRPDTGSVGFRQLGVEVYGGALWNSWLDRDLGLAGRLALRSSVGSGVETRLVQVDRPLARIPQLAIHLDRGVNDNGLKLNPQTHLVPIWAAGAAADGDLLALLAGEAGVDPGDVLAFDLMLHDVQPPALLGEHQEFVSAPRIDNQLSCWAAVETLCDHAKTQPHHGAVVVASLFDFEEVGSETATGAASALLPTVPERVSHSLGGDRDSFHRALSRSICVSTDGAHATHPNYAERHDPHHRIDLNGGPVIKVNSNARYATDAETTAAFVLAAETAGVPTQRFTSRNDMPCGSTIGPITATRLGIPVVDVGVAQLSMHSARELCGSWDPAAFVRALTAFVDAT